LTEELLKVEGLRKYYPVLGGLLKRKVGEVKAVDGADFSISTGKTLGLVGESGSGKTTVGKVIARLYPPTSGTIKFKGTDIGKLSERAFRPFRPKIQMVFQDPTSSLNPRRRIKDLMLDPLRANRIGTEDERRRRIMTLLELVGLPAEYAYRYPHMLSGGQKQRIGIARAIVSSPDLIVLDEPTSALDVSVQAQIVELLQKIQKELNLTYIFISHNIILVRNVADEIVVMYLGRVMERGPASEVFASPKHPYTISLLSSIPTLTDEEADILPDKIPLTGETPSPMNIPPGCRFASRCPYVMDICKTVEPELVLVGQQEVRCHLFPGQSSSTNQ
jgi:oligopeptide transport system ATP-binding protein